MGYPINRSNSKQFMVAGEKLAFGVADDGMCMNWGLFRQGGDGQWYAVPPLINDNISPQQIMAAGSVAKFIESQFPIMQQRLADYLKIQKPSQDDKVGCVGYDLALDVDGPATDLSFKFNKEPPLSHAR